MAASELYSSRRCTQSTFEKTQRSQRVDRAAVPSKQSSPPAEKCGVCIGATPASQAEMAENASVRGLRQPNSSYSAADLLSLVQCNARFLDDIEVFRTLAAYKRPEPRHRLMGRQSAPSLHMRCRRRKTCPYLVLRGVDYGDRAIRNRRAVPGCPRGSFRPSPRNGSQP